jgi:myo-inositol-1(or 4)-monophosphatase
MLPPASERKGHGLLLWSYAAISPAPFLSADIPVPLSALLTVMINAVRKAARGVQRDFGEVANLQVSLKGPANFVTNADRRCEKVLRSELERARPGYGFLMEEAGLVKGSDPDHRWIIDPIDGTTNFIHAVPLFAISLALERKGELVAAVTYNPITDELFTAEKGRGAFLNNRRLRVAARRDIHEALVACGVPHRGEADHARFRQELAHIQTKVSGIRRLGSATLELAYVAAGRFDAFWERGLSSWDLAAGILMIREAGGFVSDCDGDANPLETGAIIAANADLLPQIRDELRKARSPVLANS